MRSTVIKSKLGNQVGADAAVFVKASKFNFNYFYLLKAKEGAVDVPAPVRPLDVGGTFVRPA